jgi:hypothetical protein
VVESAIAADAIISPNPIAAVCFRQLSAMRDLSC